MENKEREVVYCELCRLPFGQITETHLRASHGIGLDEYMKQFPMTKIVSDEVEERRSSSLSTAHSGREFSQEHLEALSEAQLARYQTPEGIEFRKRKADIFRETMQTEYWKAQYRLGISRPGYKEEVSESLKRRWADPAYRERRAQSASEAMKKLWANPDFAARVLEAQRKSPNRPEATLMRLLEGKWPGTFQFHTDGGCTHILWMWGYRGRRQPDIVRVDGNKQVIFSNGNYWHEDEDEDKLTTLFKEVGIDCIIVWADSWEDVVVGWPKIVERIKIGLPS